MKTYVDNFSNPSSGDMAAFARTASARSGLYECAQCKRQFTVTTQTPMHSTKLPLWKWMLAMYYMINSSKGTDKQ